MNDSELDLTCKKNLDKNYYFSEFSHDDLSKAIRNWLMSGTGNETTGIGRCSPRDILLNDSLRLATSTDGIYSPASSSLQDVVVKILKGGFAGENTEPVKNWREYYSFLGASLCLDFAHS